MGERLRPRADSRAPTPEQLLARILARASRTRESVALIKQLLAQPSGLTVPMLRIEPDWDNLRDDPEFKALLADPKNSAPLQ